ncbi:Lrp/AsnC family transcriptional regulator [Aquicoccus sp. G2-2]|jgi:Lrp/AsnC family leucine-responsive transcriptional regulator|uniref:Lrp/AsnC family transcriptional regulator n=1 Tax=Aquicoccus sp. G2-2 TaxID=3092120 RepID=UPI002AE03CC3|nr:Lrp/AsnC ligand binding domain-containing protein [Aquicoccus sp. G2-2]MEA1115065.1 winged helix-turn-helix transcriptional regulator [Aquicoccus sp. G2-2]
MARELDKIDQRILNELQADGRLSIVALAARVNLTNTPCSERVRRLEKSGLIKRYAAVVDPALLGYSHLSVVQVSLETTSGGALDDFNAAVRQIKEIESCLMIAGSFDYVLVVRTRDITHFREILGERISRLPGIRQSNSFAVMEVVKEASGFPVGE